MFDLTQCSKVHLFNHQGVCFLTGVSIHTRGFGFVQFEREEDARKAQEGENGTKLNGLVLGMFIICLFDFK